MNCQKLSLEACTHAAQNERLPLRVIFQVLFFEQLRLRTAVAGWFFVSDNIDNSRGSQGSIRLSKNGNSSPIQTEISEDQKTAGANCEDDEQMLAVDNDDEVRSCISQLERECWSLKQDLGKLGKAKGFWERLCSKIGAKTRHHYRGKQVFMEC